MSQLKAKIAVAIAAAVVTGGVIGTLEPPLPTSDEQSQGSAQNQKSADELAHADELGKEGYLARGATHEDAQIAQKAIPGEYRPAEIPDLRIQIFP